MTTERLYYTDSHCLQFTAQILATTTHEGRPALLLDRTCFYPEGGGQPGDIGQIAGQPICDVQTRADDRAVLHILGPNASSELPTGPADCQIDAAHRGRYQVHHSGQHILSAALIQAADAATVGFHMSADSITIDINRADLSPSQWATAEALANQIVWQNRPVRAWFPSAEELATLPIRKMPDVVGKVRIVDIGGFDITACAGTHVKATGEIGLIKIIKTERHGKTTRIEFRCGSQAFADYTGKHELVRTLADMFSTGPQNISTHLAALQESNKSLQAELKAAQERLAKYESDSLYASAPEQNGVRLVAQCYEGRSGEALRFLAQQLAAQPNAVAMLASTGPKSQLVFARSANLKLDMAALLKVALAGLSGGKGGGRPELAQGGADPATSAQLEAALAAAAAAAINQLG
jgi:alanyl-tRNA synthetase